MFITYEELCKQMGVKPLSKARQEKINKKNGFSDNWIYSEEEENPYKWGKK